MKIQSIFRKKDAEFSQEEFKSFPLDELFKIAQAEKPKPQFVLAKDYAKVTRELREKGFCWIEIVRWFESQGVPFSLSSIRRAYRIIYERDDLGY